MHIPKMVYNATVVPPVEGYELCLNAMVDAGFLVHCTPNQKWWPGADMVGDMIIWQPNHVIKFRPYENRHVEHLRDTIALQQLLDLFAVESNPEGDSEEEVTMLQNTARNWIYYSPNRGLIKEPETEDAVVDSI